MEEERCAQKKLVPVYAAIATVSCIGYYIVLKTMHSCRLFKKPHYLLLVFLSISDCSFVLVMSIFYAIITLLPIGELCNIITSSGQYLCHVAMHLSCCFSVALTINQFIAVRYGLRYQSIVTCTKMKLLAKIFVLVIAVINGMVLVDVKYVVVLHAKMIRSRCLLSSTIMAVSGSIMLINLVYCNRVSRSQMKRLTTMEIGSPYWQHRRRIRKEVTIITSVVISVLLPQTIFYTKVHIRLDPFDGIWLAATRAMLQLFCALNPYLYMFTLKPLKTKVAQKALFCFSCMKSEHQQNPQSRSGSFDTLESDVQEHFKSHANQNMKESAIVKKNALSSAAYKLAQKEMHDLKSTNVVQSQMSVGIYIPKP